MEDILKDIGLGDLVSTFEANKINPKDVLNLTSEEFTALGVIQIGDKVRLRQCCRDHITALDDQEIPVLRRLRAMRQSRCKKSKHDFDQSKRKLKHTRRVTIGWKHSEGGGVYKLMTLNKGGGRQEVDIEKHFTLEEVISLLSDKYFPNGQNDASGIVLNDLNQYIATFTGNRITERLNFQFGSFVEEVGTNPIRIYLHTSRKKLGENRDQDEPNQNSATADVEVTTADEARTTAAEVRPTADEARTTADEARTTADEARTTADEARTTADEAKTTADEARTTADEARTTADEARTTADEARATIEDEQSLMDADSFVEAGTPVVSFRIQRRLPLCRPIELADQILVVDEEHQQHSEFSDNNIDEDIRAEPQHVTEDSLNSILQRLAAQTTERRSNMVNVSRYAVLQGAIRAFKRKTFDPTSRLSVKFVDEYAIDDGGPTREFLRLLMSEMSNLPIFCGPEHAKMLDLNYPALQEQTYELVGHMMAYSIVHSGPMPSFLHPLLYDAMSQGINSVQPSTDDIMDLDYRNQVIKLSEAEVYTGFEDLIQMAGCSSMATKLNRRDELCKGITKFIVFGRVHQCFDQFCQGLATLGVFAELKLHGERMKELFVHEERPLDAVTLEILFDMELSEANSNRRRAEEIVVSNWRDFLLDLEEGNDVPSLENLLVFVTGADGIPPLGFDPSPRLLLHQNSVDSPEDQKNFPFANTCANSLSIPMISVYEVFKKNMIAAIQLVTQFTTE